MQPAVIYARGAECALPPPDRILPEHAHVDGAAVSLLRELGFNLSSLLEAPQIGRQAFTVTEITTSEPDLSFFQPPQGYKAGGPSQEI